MYDSELRSLISGEAVAALRSSSQPADWMSRGHVTLPHRVKEFVNPRTWNKGPEMKTANVLTYQQITHMNVMAAQRP